MKNKKNIKSNFNFDIIAYVLLLMFSSLLSFFAFESIFDAVYYDLFSLIVFILLLGFLLFLILRILKIDFITLNEENLCVRNVLGFKKNEFKISEIKEYSDFDWRKKGTLLKLFYQGYIYKINSNSRMLYKAVKSKLRANKVEFNRELLLKKIVSSVVLGFLTLGFSFIVVYETLSFNAITENDITEVIGKIVNDIEISSQHHRRGRDTYYIEIEFDYYKDVVFVVIDDFLSVLAKQDFLNDIKKGKVIALKISKQDFNNVIEKDSNLNFLEKGLIDNRLAVYELSDERYTYLSSDNTIYIENENAKSNFGYGIFLFLVLFFISLYFFKEALKDYKIWSKFN